jgi:hypothetical protein
MTIQLKSDYRTERERMLRKGIMMLYVSYLLVLALGMIIGWGLTRG